MFLLLPIQCHKRWLLSILEPSKTMWWLVTHIVQIVRLDTKELWKGILLGCFHFFSFNFILITCEETVLVDELLCLVRFTFKLLIHISFALTSKPFEFSLKNFTRKQKWHYFILCLYVYLWAHQNSKLGSLNVITYFIW